MESLTLDVHLGRGLAKVGLLLVSLALLASMGGGFVALPVLAPAYVWASRRSTVAGRLLWATVAGLGAAEVGWAVVYLSIGEAKPAIWLGPLVVAIASGAALLRYAHP